MMGGIGDMVHLTPTLWSTHRCFPKAKISFLVYKSKAEELIKKAPFVDKIFRVGVEVNTLNIIPRLRSEGYDMTFISSGTNPIKSGILCYLIGALFRVGEESLWCNISIKSDNDRHYLISNLKLVEAIGCQADDNKREIWLDKSDWDYKKNLIEKYQLENKNLIIGIHPGSGKRLAFKRWPLDKFASLANKIWKKYDATFIIFGGPEEKELAKKLAANLKFKPINIVGNTILQTAASISICKLFISSDTGLMHIATSFKIPVIAIFGPTQHILYGPYGVNNVVIRHNLPCSPCYKKKPIKCNHLRCIKGITDDEVLKAVEKQLTNLKIINTK